MSNKLDLKSQLALRHALIRDENKEGRDEADISGSLSAPTGLGTPKTDIGVLCDFPQGGNTNPQPKCLDARKGVFCEKGGRRWAGGRSGAAPGRKLGQGKSPPH